MKRLSQFLAATALLCSGALLSPMASAQILQHDHAAAGASADTTQMSAGEVIKVDKGRSRITLKHGPLANLEMPGMTMVFRVKEPAMLDQVQPGDKVRFVAEKMNGALVLSKIEAAR